MADKEPANKSDAIAETPQPKRKKTKAAIVVGVIAAIVVVAGVGFSMARAAQLLQRYLPRSDGPLCGRLLRS